MDQENVRLDVASRETRGLLEAACRQAERRSAEPPEGGPGRAVFPCGNWVTGPRALPRNLIDGPLPSPAAEPSLMGMPQPAERWTADLVRSLPDDGQRYELISGILVVTPAPRRTHQLVVGELYLRLREWLGAHPELEVVFAPADIALGEDEILQPDLFVVRNRPGQPAREWSDVRELALVIEVLSPSTAHYDRHLKRKRYQRAGVPEYWIVDAEARQVERWCPGDEAPEVLTEQLRWSPVAGGPAHVLDLRKFFSMART